MKSPAPGFDKTYASVLREFGDCDDVEYLIKEWDAAAEWIESAPAEAMHRLSIRKVHGKDSGVFDAMNQSIPVARGQWILFLNAGDWLAEGFGSKCLEFLKAHAACDFIYCDGVTVDVDDGREFLRRSPEKVQLNDFLHHAPILHPCLIVKQSHLAQRLFDLGYDLAADFDLMVELVAQGLKGQRLPAVGAFILSGGLSEQRRVRGKRQALRSLLHNAPSLKFKLLSYAAYLRFLCRHLLIVYGVRSFGPLRRWAKSRSGGQPSGTYS
jgi:hypothetical protein